MKKVATITFHASHNYGSCLQAYALQRTIEKLGHDCEIINFRTKRQKEMYSIFTKRKGLKYVFKNLTHLLNYNALKKKHSKFEDFIGKNLKVTSKEYNTLEELCDESFNYDCFVCGSDQIWNPMPSDFDWAYYLPFVKEGKKIAYAPSFGPFSFMGDGENKNKIGDYLKSFDAISVREKKSLEDIKALSAKSAEVVLDPTLLLEKDEWESIMTDERIIKEDYIFLYTLFANPEIIKIAKKFSKKLKLPVVVSNFTNQYDIITPFKKHYECGPKDFLNLIKNAKLVLVSSFHGTVFSIKFKKPFFAIGGNKDARISTLLEYAGLTDRSIDISSFEEKEKNTFNISFEDADKLLNKKINESINYLRKAL